jgi:hypothetical protein
VHPGSDFSAVRGLDAPFAGFRVFDAAGLIGPCEIEMLI